jgi:uncharacterized protein
MPSSPPEIVREFIGLVGGADIERMASFWSDESAVLEVPYAPPPWPTRIEGKKAVVDYMNGVHTVITGWSMGVDEIYDVGDGTVIVEMHGAGTVVATNKPYGQNYIAVMRVVDGKLQLWREYSNPLPVFEAFGDSQTVDA